MWKDAVKKLVEDAVALIQAEGRQRPVILIFGTGSYGDAIQITPLIEALHGRFPEAAIILVHHDSLGAGLLEAAPHLTKYIRVHAGFQHHLRSRLRDGGCDLVVQCRYVVKYNLPNHSRLTTEQREFVLAAQAVQKPWLHLVQNFALDNDLLFRSARDHGWSMYELAARTGGFPDKDFEAVRIYPRQPAPDLSRLSLPPRYMVVSNSAHWLTPRESFWTKCLPHPRMRAVLEELKKQECPTVLLGTLNDPGRYDVDYDFRGKTNLIEAAEIIRGAQLVLGPEGALVNIARAMEVPSVVFFGSTPLEFFGFKTNVNLRPRVCGGCWWSTNGYLGQCPLLEPVPPCTDSHDPAEIARAVVNLLEKRRSP